MSKFIVSLFKYIPVKYRWMSVVVMAFLSMLSFFHINSLWADQHHLNGWLLAFGILMGGVAVIVIKWALDEQKHLD
jgi:hypothetical protein